MHFPRPHEVGERVRERGGDRFVRSRLSLAHVQHTAVQYFTKFPQKFPEAGNLPVHVLCGSA
jgi:hypothetical protein